MNNFNNKSKKNIPFQQSWEVMQNAAGRDVLKEIGPISREEYDYYENLK